MQLRRSISIVRLQLGAILAAPCAFCGNVPPITCQNRILIRNAATNCDIDSVTVDAFEAAESMGRYLNASIKSHFDCQTGRVPSYQ